MGIHTDEEPLYVDDKRIHPHLLAARFVLKLRINLVGAARNWLDIKCLNNLKFCK